jgi:hypothetical protein
MVPPQYLTSPQDMVNDAIVQAPMFGRLLMGRNPSEVLQGGARIRDTILLSVLSTYQSFLPGEGIGGYANRQSASLQSVDWRFGRDYWMYTEPELDLAIPEGASPERRHAVYKSLRHAKEQEMWTSLFNGIETQIFADPATAQNDMEAQSGKEPYGLYALVNAETNRLPISAAGVAWTTVMGIARATETGFQNVLANYDFADPDDIDGNGNGLLDALEDGVIQTNWIPPRPMANNAPATEEYFQRSGQDPSKRFIGCSNTGLRFYKRRLLEHNDRTVEAQDPSYTQPKFAGIPVENFTRMGTATWYNNAAATAKVSELAATVNVPGPRFFGIDGNYLKPVIHETNFFKRVAPFMLPGQPDSHVNLTVVYFNLFLRSAARQFVVAPGG